MVSEIENLNPNVYKKLDDRKTVAADWDDGVDDPFDEREVFGEFQKQKFPSINVYIDHR